MKHCSNCSGHQHNDGRPFGTINPCRCVNETQEAERKFEAIDRVEENNSPDPLEQAKADAVANLDRLPEKVSSDTILPDLEVYGFTDPRAMGPVMIYLKKQRHIEPAGEWRKSVRPGNHQVPKAVYLNLHHPANQ